MGLRQMEGKVMTRNIPLIVVILVCCALTFGLWLYRILNEEEAVVMSDQKIGIALCKEQGGSPILRWSPMKKTFLLSGCKL